MNNLIYIPLKDLKSLEDELNKEIDNCAIYNYKFEEVLKEIKKYAEVEINPNSIDCIYNFISNKIVINVRDTKKMIHEFIHYIQFIIEFAPFDGDFNFSMSEIVAEMIAFNVTKENGELSYKYANFYKDKIIKAGYSMEMISKIYEKRYTEVEKELIRFIPNIFKFFS